VNSIVHDAVGRKQEHVNILELIDNLRHMSRREEPSLKTFFVGESQVGEESKWRGGGGGQARCARRRLGLV
jgi:hypothetical protein